MIILPQFLGRFWLSVVGITKGWGRGLSLHGFFCVKRQVSFIGAVIIIAVAFCCNWLSVGNDSTNSVEVVPSSRSQQPKPESGSDSRINKADKILADAFKNRTSKIQIEGHGTVDRVLADDNSGSRHQRFILRLNSGQTLLVAHNIDLAKRIPMLKVGDRVDFCGVYEWNEQGGVIHWTHLDPARKHATGWLRHNGRVYK